MRRPFGACLHMLATLCTWAISGLLPFILHAQKADSPSPYSIRKKVDAVHGAVVSAHPLASRAGVAILKEGGNAVDAAIATQLVLAVVYPGAGNIGGGGFMVAHLAGGRMAEGKMAEGKNIAIDFREAAPGKATRDMYLDTAGNPQPELSQNGHLAAGVPGTVAGLFAELKYAKLPFSQLIEPAIGLAEKGFVLTAAEAHSLNEAKDAFVRYNTVTPVFVRPGGWKAGDTLVQKDLARTLRRIRDQGRDAFYGGLTAKLIVREMQRGKGIMTAGDLARYKAVERQPAIFAYKAYTVVTMPLPGSGSVVLQQMMKMAGELPMKEYGFESLESVHYMAEIERLAYADRAKYLGDPDFYPVPVRTLTEDAYLTERLRHIDPSRAGNSQDIQAGVITEKSEETTHLDVCDGEGNAVSITTTLNGGYGSKVVVAGAGFLLNNEMDDFSSKPGTPNMFGAIGAEANAIVPGKRMLSSMTPTIVLDKGTPYLILGTPGGTTITTSIFQTLMDILEFGLSAQDAVDKPKFHHQWLPDTLYIERDFPFALRRPLHEMGYNLVERSPIGRTEIIEIVDGRMEAVADRRGEDAADGY